MDRKPNPTPDQGTAAIAPFIYSRGATLVLIDSRDEPWAIFDCCHIGGRLVVVEYGNAEADVRVFESVDGPRYACPLTGEDSRIIDAARAQDQLHRAELLVE